MNVLKSFKITQITALLYNLNLTQLDAVNDALWRFYKEGYTNGLQSRDNETSK